MMWWLVVFLLCVSALDIIVKYTGASASPRTDDLSNNPSTQYRRVAR